MTIQMWIWIQEFVDGIFITLDLGHAPDGLLVFNKFNLHVHVPAVVPRDTVTFCGLWLHCYDRG